MLILSRKTNEEICIGEDIIITMLSYGRGQARLGIDCPKGIPVHRREIKERIDEEARRGNAVKGKDC